MANIFQRLFGKKQEVTQEPEQYDERPTPAAFLNGNSQPRGAMYAIFDGETTLGGVGPVKNYVKDFYTLRARSKQLYLESPLCHTVINRFVQWVVGEGLRLESEPRLEVLRDEGVTLDAVTFDENIENLWQVCSSSKMFDNAGVNDLPALMRQAAIEGKLGGDVFVVLRVVNGIVKIQLIDGAHLVNPVNCELKYNKDGSGDTEFVYSATGNRVRYGVEIDEDGAPVAYHVRIGTGLESVRVEARDKKGFVRAYKYFGFRPDVDATSGTPILSVVMESVKKLDRFVSAALTGAEERAKFAILFEHDQHSVEDDPLATRRAKALVGMTTNTPGALAAADIAVDAQASIIANDVAVSMERTALNLPRGVKAKAIGSETEANIAGFATFHIDLICAALNIPPNVALSKYEDSFSASRMAGKDWEHTFMTERKDFAQQFLGPVYALQMYLWVQSNKVQAPGYLQKLQQKNEIALAAYTHCRWVGDQFPDIDPLKTVKYVREMLGPTFEHMPLGTPERAAEIMGNGDYKAILKQSGKALENAAQAGIKPPPPKGTATDKPDKVDAEEETTKDEED